jgi:hypothetical protein
VQEAAEAHCTQFVAGKTSSVLRASSAARANSRSGAQSDSLLKIRLSK